MRERCRIESPVPPPSDMRISPMENVISDIMKKIGLQEDHWLNTLGDEWSELVGATVAAHTCPGQFENGKLTIYVDGSIWLYDLQRNGRKLILKNLAARYGKGKIKDILFLLGDIS